MTAILEKYNTGTKEFVDMGSPELHFSFSKYNEGLTSPWHYHEKTYFTYIQKGGNMEHRKNSSFECLAGMLFIYNSDYLHYNDKGREGSKNFNIEIEDSWFRKYEIDRTNLVGSQRLDDPHIKSAFLKIIGEVSRNDAHSSMGIEGYLLQIFSGILRSRCSQTQDEPSWVKQVRDYLVSAYLPDVSLNSLSLIANLHPVTLSKEFPVYFGTGFSDYIRNLKCDNVLHLLSKRSLSLQKIAQVTGFCDASHLVSTFKKKFNQTPAEYRASL